MGINEHVFKRLSCGRDFNLEELLYASEQLYSSQTKPQAGDIIPVYNGAYHIEITSKHLNWLYNNLTNYSGESSGEERLRSFMKFMDKKLITDYSTVFSFETYKGRILNLDLLLEKMAVNSMEASVLLTLAINADAKFREEGFSAYCLSGIVLKGGNVGPQVLAVNVISSHSSYLLIPSYNLVREVFTYNVSTKDSPHYEIAKLYETPNKKIIMLEATSKLFRKKKKV
jgi:hypothetical protein